MPVVNIFADQNKCKKISALGTIEEVFSKVETAFGGYVEEIVDLDI